MTVQAWQHWRVAGVVVSYRPDLPCLFHLIEACLPQLDALLVVDNGSGPEALTPLEDFIHVRPAAKLIAFPENRGLAAAQAAGIQWARGEGATHVILFDQDSLPSPHMVPRLLQAMDALETGGARVAAVGPRLVDEQGHTSPFARFSRWKVQKIPCAARIGYVRSDFLVASGLLAPVTVYAEVGLPEEGLFIDNIDLEWCFRAAAQGYACYGVCAAELHHQVGEGATFLPGLRSMGPIHLHGPLRQYYIARNRVILYFRPYCPPAWRFQDLFRLAFKLFYFSLFVPPRRRNLAMMLAGIRDGLRGRTGPYFPPTHPKTGPAARSSAPGAGDGHLPG